jgi:hypothetical protein
MRVTLVLALLLSVGTLLGASAVHVHEGDVAQGQCVVCRWSHEAVPLLVVAFVLLLSLPDSGDVTGQVLVPRSLARPRRTASRAPPLV